MEDKRNIEIIKEVTKTVNKTTKNPKVNTDKGNRVEEIVNLSDAGFNVNQIGSMLAIHTTYVKEVIERENAKL